MTEKIRMSANGGRPTRSKPSIIIYQAENLVANMLSDIVCRNSLKIEFLSQNNSFHDFGKANKRHDREVNYHRKSSKHRFAMFLYILAIAHKNLLYGEKTTVRGLFYANIALTVSQNHVNSALRDISYIIEKPTYELGIIPSGKGLVAGAVVFVMTNGDLIDCSLTCSATIIPSDFERVFLIKTTANFVLLVEKDTVFQKLISDSMFRTIVKDVILVTGKGFPDMATRLLINRLCFEFDLPVYALVDADPFGIEILLVYKYGSYALAHVAPKLACPRLQWMGIHPSEIRLMELRSEPLTQRDKKKVSELLDRKYIEISFRKELQIMQRLERKAEVENVTVLTLNFLIEDYIPNKIKRQLML